MLKACPYCKGVHPIGYVCPKKPLRKKNDRIAAFRNSMQWQYKREHICRRDGYMCRLCAIGYGGEPVKYNPNVSAHHIESLAEAWEKRLDDNNLICLCSRHHEQAENGEIDKELLKKLAVSDVFSSSRATLK
ncbi:MAG: HNH endonuclease [Oscillospiraceae bacterium]|nr:HNH endonuclease [Oscillospiraceae bacterium]